MLWTQLMKKIAVECLKCMCLFSLSAFSCFFSLLSFHSFHFSLSTLPLIYPLLHLTGDWTPPGALRNFTRGRDQVTNWKISLQSSPCVFIPFPPHPLITTSPTHLCLFISVLFLPFLPCIVFFLSSLPAPPLLNSFLHVSVNAWPWVDLLMWIPAGYRLPVDTLSSVCCLSSHSHIPLCYKVHRQTDLHFNNSDLFIIFLPLLIPFCIFWFINAVLKLYMFINLIFPLLSTFCWVFFYSFLLLLCPAGINKVFILSFCTLSAPALHSTSSIPLSFYTI